MNTIERIHMVKAMEYIARQLNDETIFLDLWLNEGVADGDVEYGDLAIRPEDSDEWGFGYYLSDENFACLMQTFLNCMAAAKRSGGLYCDGVVSGKPKS